MKTHVGRLQIVDEPEELARITATTIVEAARERPQVGLLLASGATLRRAYDVVAMIGTFAEFAGVHVWLADERPVPLEHEGSHGGALLRAWGERLGFLEDLGGGVRMPVARFHAMPCGRGVAKQLAETSWTLHDLAGPSPRPDLTVLGVGADGHTAGIYAGDATRVSGGYFASAKGGERVTATSRLLVASRRLVFVVAGAAKADVAARVFADPHALPAGVIALEAKAAGSEVTWLLDRAAVAKIA